MIIAIDGPAASGKGTIGRRLAQYFGYQYLDTGLLYRAVGSTLKNRGLPSDDEKAAVEIAGSLNVEEVMSQAAELAQYGDQAAEVAAIPSVRAVLLSVQRTFAVRKPGAVLDGRDIGTVICPHAEVKIFVTATPEVRARRRVMEFQARGEAVDEADVLGDILRRDQRDSSRAVAPLKPAPDAHLLDTTALDADGAFQAAVRLIEGLRRGRS